MLRFVRSKVKDKNLNGIVIYFGIVPFLSRQIIYGDSFEVELYDPQTKDSLIC